MGEEYGQRVIIRGADGRVMIGEGSLISIRVIILPQIEIGAWTNVIENLPNHVVAVGIPIQIL